MVVPTIYTICIIRVVVRLRVRVNVAQAHAPALHSHSRAHSHIHIATSSSSGTLIEFSFSLTFILFFLFLLSYGGFSIPIQPSFNPLQLVFLQHFNGVLAIANIRGGAEYGEDWHKAGILEK